MPVSASRFDAKYTASVTQKPEGLMVWAAMDGKGKLILRRCPKKVKSADYQTILGDSLSFIRRRCGVVLT